MDFSTLPPPSEVISYALGELRRATVDKKHPFRFFTMNTTLLNRSFTRTVVLRQMLDAHTLRIYTDARSEKINHLKAIPEASLLFYHPKKQLQIVAQTEVKVLSEGAEWEDCWRRVPEYMQKDYQSLLSPGSEMDWHKEGHPQDPTLGNQFFRVIDLRVTSLDVLKLKREGHRRFTITFPRVGDPVVKRIVP